MSSKIFVGNLNFTTSRDSLSQLFGQIGQLEDVYLPLDRETSRPRGFAFVTFASDEDAKKAIEKFNGYELDGRQLRVNAAEDRPRRTGPPPFRGAGGGYSEPAPDFRDSGYGGGYGGGGGGGRFEGGKAKGSRRNVRAKKRSL